MMNNNANVKLSSLPAGAVLLVIFLIVSWLLGLIIGAPKLFVQIWIAVTIVWSAKLVFDLTRWLRSDKAKRSEMRFPYKSSGAHV
ncbi:MAG: hypothetical protein ACI84R_000596 [Candidatus Azotimanducaceae bacterium]|jgi:hypothetical protein